MSDNISTTTPPTSRKSLSKVTGIFRYIKPYIHYFIIGMICLVVSSVILMVLLGLPGEMANTAVGNPKFKLNLSVNDYGLVFLVALIVQAILSYVRTYTFAIVAEKGMANLRKELYDKMITQPITFFEERRVGELTSRITTDVEQLQSVFSITLAEFIRQIVTLITGIIIIIYWTPKLSLIMLLTFPAVIIVAMVFGRYIRRLSKQRQDQLAKTNTIVEETFQNFAIVKSFANEWFESKRYKSTINDVVGVSLHFAKIRGIFFIFIITILFGAIFFILWRGALMVEQGTMESGDLFSFIIYTGILGGAIASFGTLYTQILSAIGATERILDILELDSEVESIQYNTGKISIAGDIRYDDVYFSYPSRSDILVLKGINLSIKNGQKIALVGQSGSGKSTIIQLLMQFYKPNQGQISIDGKNIQEYSISELRKNIGIVPQEVILFGGSIKENILYGKTDATDEEVLAAAEKSNCLEFITSFPDGVNTIVGERGVKLSGGQKQRIAIARAILKNPKILILDEATSSLDAESERLVQDALNKLMDNRTSIIIAHRLSTIRTVDNILVLDHGVIKEMGTHEQLYANESGLYHALATLQLQSKDDLEK